MKKSDWNIGVCSWSLKNDFVLMSRLKDETGVRTVHLQIQPEDESASCDFIQSMKMNGWQISAAMITFEQEDYSTLESIRETGGIVPDSHWDTNKKRVENALDIISGTSIPYLTFHFGFLDPENSKLTRRIVKLADYAASKGKMLLMETGQETAGELRAFLEKVEHPALGINFDPANMILYGKGDPAESVNILKEWIRHIHIKDAAASAQPGVWGTEVPWSAGEVNSESFLNELVKIGYKGALCVEREQGEARFDDIKSAVVEIDNFAGQVQ